MADGQVNIPLTRDGRGRIRSFKLKVPVIVQNVTMPAKTKVTLMAFGSGKKLVGFGSSKSKFDLKKGTIIKWYTLTFKVPGSFAFASQLIYPSGVQTKFMTFNVIPPP